MTCEETKHSSEARTLKGGSESEKSAETPLENGKGVTVVARCPPGIAFS
jgi:hypothetical protein